MNIFKLHRQKIVGIAATFILAMCIYFWQFYINQIEFITKHSEHLVVYLPDSSRVKLNAESLVRYDKSDWEDKREIILKGEAFFEVKKGEQFSVISNSITTTVLGTSFNVFSRNNNVEIACVTGKVSVRNNNISHLPVVLTPGLGSEIMGDNIPSKPYKLNVNQRIGWISRDFYFSSKPINEVFAELERQFGYPIFVQKDIDQQLFTGLIKGKDIDRALEIICLSANLQYSFSADSTVIIF